MGSAQPSKPFDPLDDRAIEAHLFSFLLRAPRAVIEELRFVLPSDPERDYFVVLGRVAIAFGLSRALLGPGMRFDCHGANVAGGSIGVNWLVRLGRKSLLCARSALQ